MGVEDFLALSQYVLSIAWVKVIGHKKRNFDCGNRFLARRVLSRTTLRIARELSRIEGKRWAQEALRGDSSRDSEANTSMLVGSLHMM